MQKEQEQKDGARRGWGAQAPRTGWGRLVQTRQQTSRPAP